MNKNTLFIISFFLIAVLTGCSSSKKGLAKPIGKIVDKPIIFNAERKELTLNYLKEHYNLEQNEPTIIPKMIVLHWTVIPTFDETFDVFNKATLNGGRNDLSSAGNLNVSSQFLIDRDGVIYRLLPENTMARHVIGLNHCAIGVENVGGPQAPLTKAQLKANIWLVTYLKEKYNIDYLIGHYEYTLFEGHEHWLEVDNGYRTVKTDPGTDFMNKMRNATQELNFKPLPVQ